jgi:protein-disulfide isomerase
VQQASDLGLTGTPAFFVNGRPLHGAQPLEAFAQVIDEELRGSGGGGQ